MKSARERAGTFFGVCLILPPYSDRDDHNGTALASLQDIVPFPLASYRMLSASGIRRPDRLLDR